MKDVTIKIKRFAFKEFYTVSRITVDGVYVCDGMEDKVRVLNSIEDKIKHKTAIPAGTYKGVLFTSKKFGKVIHILDVPYFTEILMHKGNTADDSSGCVLCGFNTKVGWLSNPTMALNKLIKAVEGADKIIVTIE